MKVMITNDKMTIQWNGVYYFALSNYPNISLWEIKKLMAFMDYEKKHGRETEITCEDENILTVVNEMIANSKTAKNATPPNKITECIYCMQAGCLTEYVCHTAAVDASKKIFSTGKLLSAVNAFHQNGAELAGNSRNAAGDPPDYFEYIMFTWGNCTAGYRLVMERHLGRNPTDDELENKLIPGIRFYFRYHDIITHSGYVFDGYHPVKIKDELVLSDYLYACIIPCEYKGEFERLIPLNIIDKIHYIPHLGLGLRSWSNKVYEYIRTMKAQRIISRPEGKT